MSDLPEDGPPRPPGPAARTPPAAEGRDPELDRRAAAQERPAPDAASNARSETEAVLRRQGEGMRKLSEVAAAKGTEPKERLRRALQVGARHLGLEIGALVRDRDGQLLLEVLSAPADLPLREDQRLDPETTLCRPTLASTEALVFPDLSRSPHALHSIRHRLGLSAYLGIALSVHGERYGVLSFSSRAPHAGFHEVDLDFFRLLARWVEASLEGRGVLQSLQESSARLRGIIDSAMDAIITIDEQQRVVVFNTVAEQVFRLPAARAIGRTLEQFIPERFQEAHRLQVERFAHTGESARGHRTLSRVTGVRADGEEFPCHASISRVQVGGQRLMTVVLRDLSESERVEQQRRELETKAQQAQRMEALGTLAGGIAHDFNNLVSIVLMNTEMLARRLPDDAVALEGLRDVERASQRARELVRRILSFSRQQRTQRRPTQLCEVLEEVLGLLRATLPSGVELHGSLDRSTPPVLADATEIHQVAMNLCTNAWQALGDGGGSIEVALAGVTLGERDAARLPDLEPGPYARLLVADTGCGMDPRTLERIFEPFFTTKKLGQGTGLGLSVVHGIVKEMGGGVLVDSAPRKGSRFELFFPVAREAVSQPAPPRPPSPPLQGGRRRVLYVDDEALLVRIASRLLQSAGFTVVGCTRPADGLAELERDGPFALAVVDMNMPGMNGLQFSREALRLRPGLPVILTSGNLTAQMRDEAEALGVAAVLDKPFNVQALADTVRRVLPAQDV